MSDRTDANAGPPTQAIATPGTPTEAVSTQALPREATATRADSTQALPIEAGATRAIPVESAQAAQSAQSAQSAQAAQAAQSARPGWVLDGRYRVLERIGSGGMAEVFRAHDDLLDRDVAVKVFRAPVEEPGSATSVERRALELQALAHLSHPNLITLYDASLAEGRPAYLVMELVDGPNLAARLAEGPLSEPEARVIGAQVADALAYVHARGMVHRDVKPANILLGADGSPAGPHTAPGPPPSAGVRARLSDFGIVRMIDDARLTAAAFTLGTAYYVAPEQARGADVGPPADVYSLGLLLIEALTGVRAFDGPMHETLAARLDRAPAVPAGLPDPWPALLGAMTAIDPSRRPSAAGVAGQLRPGARGSVPPLLPTLVPAAMPPLTGFPRNPAPPPAAVGSAGPPRRNRHGLLIAALACLAVIGTATVLLLASGSGSPGTGPGGGPAPGGTRQAARTTPGHQASGGTHPSSAHPTRSSAPPATSAPPRSSTSAPPPSSTAPASTTPASTSPASTSPASTSPASTTPAGTAPGGSTAASTAPQSTAGQSTAGQGPGAGSAAGSAVAGAPGGSSSAAPGAGA